LPRRSCLAALAIALAACDGYQSVPWDQDAGDTDGGSNLPDVPAPPQNAAVAAADCSNGRRVQVRRVVDGDTLELFQQTGEQYERVRLIGIDTPETFPSESVQCFGLEAKAVTRQRVENRWICLTSDPALDARSASVDIYGRTLAYAFYGEGFTRFLGAELVYEGFAWARPFSSPDAVFTTYFRELERAAVDARRGLWGACP
jgi:endonuclease YncB( thermonuclease family)